MTAALYITLSETETELRAVARSHDLTLDGIDVFEMIAEDEFGIDHEQSLLHPSEVDWGRRCAASSIWWTGPTRCAWCWTACRNCACCAEPAALSRPDPGVEAFLRAPELHRADAGRPHGRTRRPAAAFDRAWRHLAGAAGQRFRLERRRLRVVKMRGLKYHGGYHDFTIERGGIRVYPRLIAADHHRRFSAEPVTTGLAGLDALLGDGLFPGTNTLLAGPAGVGKTTTAVRCMISALQRGQKAAYFLFDERLATLMTRSRWLNMDLQPFIDAGLLTIRQIDPAELSPGEFASAVRSAVEKDDVGLVVIDSLNAYLHAMPSDNFLVLQMHELLRLPGPAGRGLADDPGSARGDGRPAVGPGHQLSGRHMNDAALFRGRRRGAEVDRGQQDAHVGPRTHDPRIADRRGRHRHRRTDPGLSGILSGPRCWWAPRTT